MKQPASHDEAPRTLHASGRVTDGEEACRAGNPVLGGRALGDESHRGLKTAGVLLEPDVLVVVNGDLMLGTEKTRRGQRWHRALNTHHETLAASDEPAGKST
jgi:hypothetical protein